MTILVDSNVIIAALDRGHIHHRPSEGLFRGSFTICTATHALTEAYNHLSRLRLNGPTSPPEDVATSIQSLGATLLCRALTHAETLSAIRNFAALGGRGARLYDFLIGEAAMLSGADTIATWNTKHFTPLFPALRIATPEHLLES